jgi:hypothetical protein
MDLGFATCGRGRCGGRPVVRDGGRRLRIFAPGHRRRLRARPACALQPCSPRRAARDGLSVLPHRSRASGCCIDSTEPDLHELPQDGARQLREADSGLRELLDRHAGRVDPGSRPARLRLFQPLGARTARRRLRLVPRTYRYDGGCEPAGAAQHGLVPGLPPQSRTPPETDRVCLPARLAQDCNTCHR